jgi:hypothetical protein
MLAPVLEDGLACFKEEYRSWKDASKKRQVRVVFNDGNELHTFSKMVVQKLFKDGLKQRKTIMFHKCCCAISYGRPSTLENDHTHTKNIDSILGIQKRGQFTSIDFEVFLLEECDEGDEKVRLPLLNIPHGDPKVVDVKRKPTNKKGNHSSEKEKSYFETNASRIQVETLKKMVAGLYTLQL